MMEDEAVFSVLAQCFGPVDESSWNQLAGSSLWSVPRFVCNSSSR